MSCTIVNKDGSTGSLVLSMHDYHIEHWGTRYEHDPIFQTQNDRGADDLYTAFRNTYLKDPRPVPMTEIAISDPWGKQASTRKI